MGGRAKLMKRRRQLTSRKYNINKNQKYVADIGIMPRELIVEVLARVAASSSIDLFNAKLSCKVFNEVSEDDYIYKNVSLEEFQENPWRPMNEQAVSFLKRTKECENPESLYRQGLKDFFKDKKLESGLRYLKKAAEKGHMGALYVIGIIILHSEGDESKAMGIKIISGMKKSSLTRTKVKDFRKNFRDFIGKIWWSDDILFVEKPSICTLTGHYKANAWDVQSRYLYQECEACLCDLELALVTQRTRNS